MSWWQFLLAWLIAGAALAWLIAAMITVSKDK